MGGGRRGLGLSAAFFFQERPGLHGKIFKVIKFKTMTDERDANGELLPDAERLTKVGRFVRSTSIDGFGRYLAAVLTVNLITVILGRVV